MNNLESDKNKVINTVNQKLDQAIKDYKLKDLNDEELNKYEEDLKKLVNKTISDNEILENESFINEIIDKEVLEKSGGCLYDSNKFNENDILKELVENTTFSPLYDDYNYLLEKVDEKLYKYFDSDEYMDKFLKYLCNKENGKWITGSSFGNNETYFHKGSKCSYKTREQCDNSYNWNVMSKPGLGNVPPGLLYSDEKYKDFKNLFFNAPTKRLPLIYRNQLITLFENDGKHIVDYYKKHQTLKNYNIFNFEGYENIEHFSNDNNYKLVLEKSKYGCPAQTFKYIGKQGKYNHIWKRSK